MTIKLFLNVLLDMSGLESGDGCISVVSDYITRIYLCINIQVYVYCCVWDKGEGLLVGHIVGVCTSRSSVCIWNVCG